MTPTISGAQPRSSYDSASVLSPLDKAGGWVLGARSVARSLPTVDAPARQVLEGVVREYLARGPCAVSFSGGRDSSAVLAVAAHIARRDGLPAPIPVTMRFPDDAASREDEWQETVVRHLRLDEWIRVEPGGDGGLLGPVARLVMERLGLLWPSNAYLHLPAATAFGGGSLLTGYEGDGLFGGWRWVKSADVVARRRRPGVRDTARLVLAHAPPALRRVRMSRTAEFADRTWLRPRIREVFAARLLDERSREPALWDQRVHWWANRRYHQVGGASLEAVGSLAGTQIANPLLDGGFLAALASDGGRWGYGDRTAVMRALVGDLLAEEILTRRSKAIFTATVWDESARTFARSWDGSGVDADLVDPDELRRIWLSEQPHAATGTLLQVAWMHQQGEG